MHGFPGPRMSVSPSSPSPVDPLKYSSTMPGVGFEHADGERVLLQASSAAENAFMWVISRVIRNCSASIVPGSCGVVDQALIDDLGARLGRDVAAQIDIHLAGDLQVGGGPRIAHGVEQVDSAAAGDRDQRIGLRGFAVRLQRLQVHADERADDLQVAQFFCADIEQQIAPGNVVQTVPALDGVLHGGGELSIGSAELLQQHVAEPDVRLSDVYGVHQFLHVVIHGVASSLWYLVLSFAYLGVRCQIPVRQRYLRRTSGYRVRQSRRHQRMRYVRHAVSSMRRSYRAGGCSRFLSLAWAADTTPPAPRRTFRQASAPSPCLCSPRTRRRTTRR